MSQRERDVIKVMHPVLSGERTQAEAADLLGLSVRQVRRLRRLEAGGDGAVAHGLRGRPSNHRPDDALRRRALEGYRARYQGFGPTFASEKLREEGVGVYQLLPPPEPGLRGGRVVVEKRLGGTTALRSRGKCLRCREAGRA